MMMSLPTRPDVFVCCRLTDAGAVTAQLVRRIQDAARIEWMDVFTAPEDDQALSPFSRLVQQVRPVIADVIAQPGFAGLSTNAQRDLLRRAVEQARSVSQP
jgi:hypothetical protein